ncbi:unnamed protein product [Diatraea saccharalis]|uniref:Zinc finger PHD-type domain-containing protein n=1 Tax=Diatraea saccharalis TaxID=40085 RepID=A0A9N9WDW0_9NEOP|nr:unnamed protein product [Diatraea saccharalis]
MESVNPDSAEMQATNSVNRHTSRKQIIEDTPMKLTEISAVSIVQATPKKITETSSRSAIKDNEETPSKLLNEISPIPIKTYQIRKRAKQVATILTSEDHINYRKDCDEKKKRKQEKSAESIRKKKIKQEKENDQKSINRITQNKPKVQKRPQLKDTKDEEYQMKKEIKQEKIEKNITKKTQITQNKKKFINRLESKDIIDKEQVVQKKIKQEKIEKKYQENRTKPKKKKAQTRRESTDTEEEDQPILLESRDSSPVELYVDDCVGCGGNYHETEDWIQCIICKRWLHENCTEFDDKCEYLTML